MCKLPIKESFTLEWSPIIKFGTAQMRPHGPYEETSRWVQKNLPLPNFTIPEPIKTLLQKKKKSNPNTSRSENGNGGIERRASLQNLQGINLRSITVAAPSLTLAESPWARAPSQVARTLGPAFPPPPLRSTPLVPRRLFRRRNGSNSCNQILQSTETRCQHFDDNDNVFCFV